MHLKTIVCKLSTNKKNDLGYSSMKNMKSNEVRAFTSIEEENQYDYNRRKKMTVEERLKEFSIIQERRWGKDWHLQPIVKKVSFDKIAE